MKSLKINESKGFGFITNDETGSDIFVPATALNGVALNEGDKVEVKVMFAAQVQVVS